MTTAESFLQNHKLLASSLSIQNIVDDFLSEMDKGLQSSEGSLRMIPTYIEADNEFITGVPVIAIDAGGTNFRTALVQFNENGKLEISGLKNSRMPGIDGLVSKSEFFKIIAGYLQNDAHKVDRIGFCFSYPTEIYPDKDGRLLHFSKEVQAPEVVGQLIGKNLLNTLGTPEKQVVLLNDTVATLLAGKSNAFGKTYDSFIGYILGTGTNTCYIEKNKNITKTPNLDLSRNQIINIESGNFNKTPRTDIDLALDNSTGSPGAYTFEKMISGGYFGALCLTAFKFAANENVFSEEAKQKILILKDLNTETVNKFRHGNDPSNALLSVFSDVNDFNSANKIIDAIIERAAKLVAANIAAVILKCGKGQTKEKPVLITVEGTTFYKLYTFRTKFEQFLSDFLSGDKKRYYEFTEVEQSSLVGAALSALIN
ncbi:MAG: hypothetical protein U0W24_25125 [Bacteroidales bacterium]